MQAATIRNNDNSEAVITQAVILKADSNFAQRPT
jgi:hypothetical protein